MGSGEHRAQRIQHRAQGLEIELPGLSQASSVARPASGRRARRGGASGTRFFGRLSYLLTDQPAVRTWAGRSRM